MQEAFHPWIGDGVAQVSIRREQVFVDESILLLLDTLATQYLVCELPVNR